jgi:transcriptional regulator with XRE-family HTH domain
MSMTTDSSSDPPTAPELLQHGHSYRERSKLVLAEMKARQRLRIRELGDALVEAGLVALDEQASALGLSRSTTWTILKGNHKGSGLSATIINRMLAALQLPPLVRAKILEYVEEKTAGLYGDSKVRRRKFTARLSVTRPERSQALAADRRIEQSPRAVGQRARRHP